MSKSNYLELKILDHQTGVAAFTAPSMFLALSTTSPAEDGTNVTEPSTGGYARVALSGKWGAATLVSGVGTSANNAAISFTQSTAAWSSGSALGFFAIYDAATAGNLLRYGALDVPRTVDSAGITLTIDVGGLRLTED